MIIENLCHNYRMNNEIKIIFVDIDWTLLNHRYIPGRFDKKSIKALKKVQQKGIKVFLCTARPYHSVDQIKILDLLKPDGMILANGGLIIINNQIIYESVMDKTQFDSLCDIANKYQINLEGIRTNDAFLINNNLKEVKELFKTYPENMPPIISDNKKDILGCSLFAYKDLDEQIKKELPRGIYYYRYHDYGVDISSIPHIKGDAIKKVLMHLNTSSENAMAIGDDEGDISMFEVVKYGVAMGNAKENVKQKASIITKDISKHGVYYILKKIKKKCSIAASS